MKGAEPNPDAGPARGGRPWLWFWLAFAAASLVMLLAKHVDDARWAATAAKYQNAVAAGQRNMQSVHVGLRTMQQQWRPGTLDVTRAQVEAAFGAAGTITWTAPAPAIHFDYVDKASGFRGSFQLAPDGYGSQWGGP